MHVVAAEERRARAARGEGQRPRASRPSSCRTCSTASRRPTPPRRGARAAWASASRWCATSRCLHGGQVRADSPGLGKRRDLHRRPAGGAARGRARRHRRAEPRAAPPRAWRARSPACGSGSPTTIRTRTRSWRSRSSRPARWCRASARAGSWWTRSSRCWRSSRPISCSSTSPCRTRTASRPCAACAPLELASGVEQPIPAIALTAFTQVERERLRAAGFADRVDKPVDADKLVAAIRVALKDRQGHSASTAGAKG